MRHFTLVCFLLLLGASGPTGAAEPAAADWSAIDARPTPAWFEDAKLGIFIHWGVYSVPAFAPTKDVDIYARYAEWYWKRLTTPDMEGHAQFKAFHDRVYGPSVRYQDFAPRFTAPRRRALRGPDEQAPRRLLPVAERTELELERGRRGPPPRRRG